jgi:hypothetical protein
VGRKQIMRLSLRVAFAIGALLTVAADHAAAQHDMARPDQLLRETVAGMPRSEQQELRVLTATIQPGQATAFHTHRFPVTVYILAGAFTLEMEGREPVTVRVGEAMVEPPHVKMTGFNRGSDVTRVVIFYVSDPDTPFLDPIH